jgi:hypothetical protein
VSGRVGLAGLTWLLTSLFGDQLLSEEEETALSSINFGL